LFDYRRELLSPELVLRRLQDQVGRDLYQTTLERIARVMGLTGEPGEIAFAMGGGVVLTSPDIGVDVPLEGVADGYRVVFNWLIDMYGRALRPKWITEQGAIAGVILVDELDQHLHPELQASVMHELVDLLPDAQVVATTHSPLIALGADPSQLVVLDREGDRVVFADRVPDYRGFSADDMLADDRLFGTTVWNPDTARMLRRYEELVDIDPSERSKDRRRQCRPACTRAGEGEAGGDGGGPPLGVDRRSGRPHRSRCARAPSSAHPRRRVRGRDARAHHGVEQFDQIAGANHYDHVHRLVTLSGGCSSDRSPIIR
jgi:hypothetical protein